jgi:amidophosphoribosyltransferase
MMLTLPALVAYGKTEREIADYLGADEIIFLDIEGKNGLKAACIEAAQGPTTIENLEVGVFNGCYVTGLPDGYLDDLSDLRNGRTRQKPGLENVKAGGVEDGSVAARAGLEGLSGVGGAPVPMGDGQVNSAPGQRDDIRSVV